MIGGWISPTQIDGPHIGDGSAQTSQEGQPIAWILGTAGWVQGNIVQKSERREVKKTDDGKGSGTEVNTFEAHQDFCIMICESSETRESLMVGVLIVRVDGKIVYDMRPDKNFGAENAKFLKNHTFYDGNEAQLPDPTMEAITGVGNTPAYRGVFTMIARDINLSQYGERIPTYEFVMIGQGESVTEEVTAYTAPVYGRFQNAAFPLADPESMYLYRCFWTDEIANGHQSPILNSIDECNAWFLSNVGISAPTLYVGYSANSTGTAGSYTTGGDITTSLVEEQQDVTNIASLVLLYQWYNPVDWNSTVPNDSCPIAIEGSYRGLNNGTIVTRVTGYPAELLVFENCEDGTYSAGYYPYCIQVFPKRAPSSEAPLGDPCTLGVPVMLPDSPGFMIDCDGNISTEPIVSPSTGNFRVLQLEDFVTIDGNDFYTRRTRGPVLLLPDADNNEAFWTAAYESSVALGESPTGWVYGVNYPSSATDGIYQLTYETTSLTDTPIGLDTAITRICKRGGLTDEDIDVSEMDQDLLGYMISQSYNGADCVRPLMTGFTSYGSEYDAKLRFHKHGESIEIVIDPEDFIEGSETDKDTREQAVEYPRLISVTAIDPTQDYTARPQTERRITPDVRAIGEEQMQVPIVMTPDSQRQLAAIAMKVSWARAQGTRDFSVPYVQGDEYLHLVAGKPFALDGKRYIAAEYGLEDGEIKIKGKYDRQSAYTSNVTATPALPPTPPPSSIGGVTLFAALNIGIIRDRDDTLGLQIAVAGLLNSWPGALLQWKLDTDSDWQMAISSMTQSSTMGYLTEELPLAPSEGDDVTNTLSVAVNGGELNSITRLQYLNEGNPFAIISNETTGECEVGQFQITVESAPDVYDCTTLTRGGLNTTPSEHPAGARFVYLDSVYFLPVPIAWIGRTINLRPVTFDTVPDNNASYSILFDPAVSQVEWSPGILSGRYTGSAFVASVVPRHRLGNDLTPVASINFVGYRWTLDDGDPTHAQSFDTVDPSAVFDLSTFDSPAVITVAELNRITGPGPTLSITI